MPFVLKSAAFADGDALPEKFSQDGANQSPPLEWEGVPEGTSSFLVTMQDEDATGGPFRHWGLRNIDRGRTALPENVLEDARVPEARGCVNDFDSDRYRGPSRAELDGPHRYVICVWALAANDLEGAATHRLVDVVEEARKHVLGRAEIRCTYGG